LVQEVEFFYWSLPPGGGGFQWRIGYISLFPKQQDWRGSRL